MSIAFTSTYTPRILNKRLESNCKHDVLLLLPLPTKRIAAAGWRVKKNNEVNNARSNTRLRLPIMATSAPQRVSISTTHTSQVVKLPISTSHSEATPQSVRQLVKRPSIWRVLVYVLSFAMFVKISMAMFAFHPPRPDRPASVFGGRFVFLTVQTNFILTIYNALCLVDSLLTEESALKQIVSKLMHITSGAAFAVGSIMGMGYYGLVHFDAHTRLRAAAIQDFDFYMHLLHGVPLLFVFLDTLFKDRPFIRAAKQQIQNRIMGDNQPKQSVSGDDLLQQLKREQALARRKRGLSRMARAVKHVQRSGLLRPVQGDMVLSVAYGVFYVAWTVLCSTVNHWWPYPFQTALSPLQHAALYSTLVGVVLPMMTMVSRVLRGRATQIAVVLASGACRWARSQLWLRKHPMTVTTLILSVKKFFSSSLNSECNIPALEPIPARVSKY